MEDNIYRSLKTTKERAAWVSGFLEGAYKAYMHHVYSMEWYQGCVIPLSHDPDPKVAVRSAAQVEFDRLERMQAANPQGAWFHFQKKPDPGWIDEIEFEEKSLEELKIILLNSFMKGNTYLENMDQVDAFWRKNERNMDRLMLDLGFELNGLVDNVLFRGSTITSVHLFSCAFPISGRMADLWTEIVVADPWQTYVLFLGLND